MATMAPEAFNRGTNTCLCPFTAYAASNTIVPALSLIPHSRMLNRIRSWNQLAVIRRRTMDGWSNDLSTPT